MQDGCQNRVNGCKANRLVRNRSAAKDDSANEGEGMVGLPLHSAFEGRQRCPPANGGGRVGRTRGGRADKHLHSQWGAVQSV